VLACVANHGNCLESGIRGGEEYVYLCRPIPDSTFDLILHTLLSGHRIILTKLVYVSAEE
jgi:hypothetical protein